MENNSYKIITCNARLQCNEDGEQQFINRCDFFTKRLNELSPDVIGFQEVTEKMRKLLIEAMPEYAFLGGGREKNRLGEASIIAYKTKRLIPERLFTEMLSKTPNIPGTRYECDQSSCPRVFSSADFMPIDGGSPFRVMNIHTDHMGKEARMLEVKQFIAFYDEQNEIRKMPTILLGDFNATPEKCEIKYISEGGKFTDITKDIDGSFHNYGKLDSPIKIDYIFISNEITPIEVTMYHDKNGELFFSDHNPIEATVTF